MSSGDDEQVYRVYEDESGFRVMDDNGQTVVTCRDKRSAEHYATLLQRAYNKGYRAGFRLARRGAPGSGG